MSNPIIPIIPCDVSVVNKIGSFAIILQNFVIGVSVELIVSIFDTDKKFVSTVMIPLAGDDYILWGSDDTYLVNFICEKLNFTPQPEDEILN